MDEKTATRIAEALEGIERALVARALVGEYGSVDYREAASVLKAASKVVQNERGTRR